MVLRFMAFVTGRCSYHSLRQDSRKRANSGGGNRDPFLEILCLRCLWSTPVQMSSRQVDVQIQDSVESSDIKIEKSSCISVTEAIVWIRSPSRRV